VDETVFLDAQEKVLGDLVGIVMVANERRQVSVNGRGVTQPELSLARLRRLGRWPSAK
jgi:hypothetical protein